MDDSVLFLEPLRRIGGRTERLRAGPTSNVTTVTDQLAAGELADESDPDAADATPAADATSGPATGGRRQRISKWDRPPDPHDWRFFVGTLGKILIATGLLMFGFVAYQLWGTGIETARAQNKLENQFEQLLAEFTDDVDSGSDTGDAGGSSEVEPGDAGGTDDAPVDSGTSDTDAPADDPADDPTTAADDTPTTDDAAAIVPVAVDLSEQAVEQDIPPIVRGDVLARLEIPRIDRVDYVVPGVSLNDLKSGPGHYPDTPLPGQLGNSAIAGHRTTYGAPFFDVDQLEPSDEIIVTMANGDRFVYEVTGVEVVSASAYWVVTTANPDTAEMTLTSCHPKYTARDRIVVRSVLNPSKSSNVGVPTFYELEPEPEPIPGDDPVLDADGTADVVPGRGDSTAADGADGGADDDVATRDEPLTPDTESVDAPPTGDDPDPSSGAPLSAVPSGVVEDAFSQGWFHDMSAFSQIALWGTILTIISLAAYAISRRFRHDSIGFAVGIAPFVVALYFFFQNVNRLLPPGL
jgi:sortase A